MSQHTETRVASAESQPRRLLDKVDFALLFAAMMLWILIAPFAATWPFGNVAILVIYYVILALCLIKSNISRRWQRVVILGIALLTFNSLSYHFSPDLAYLSKRIALLNLAFVVLAPILMSRLVLSTREVDANMIFASLCAYFLLAMCWGQMYTIIERVLPGSFNVSAAPIGKLFSTLLYFSLTTLTTLGYGDVTPQTELARVLATMEAFVGQVYLVVLVARLVSLHIAGEPNKR